MNCANFMRAGGDYRSAPMKAKIAEAEKVKVHPALRHSSSADAIPLWRD